MYLNALMLKDFMYRETSENGHEVMKLEVHKPNAFSNLFVK